MKSIRILVILCGLSMASHSQSLHVNVFGGTSNYVGELFFGTGSGKLYTFKNAKPAAGIGVEYDFTNHLSFKSALTLGKIGADDKRYSIDPVRNLNFSSSITDLMIGAQYHILDPNAFILSPYVFSGIAFFHFNPYTLDSSGGKIFLQPLSTEGQGFVDGRNPYKLLQVAIPYGAGVKLSLGNNLQIAAELSVRKTFTDYLDDVSTTYVDENLLRANRGQEAVDVAYRGDEIKGGLTYPAAGTQRGIDWFKDRYYFSTITASFRFGDGGERTGRKRSRSVGCPSRF